MANKFLSREEYLDKQRQAIINQSLENSKNRINPAVPYILKYTEQEWLENINNSINSVKLALDQAIKYNHGEEKINEYKKLLSQYNNELKTGYKPELCAGDSCIYTATDNYGKKYRVSGNQSFRANPAKYGFKEINLNDIKPGDIIQDFSFRDNTPHHAITFIGYDDNNKALFNYSKGGSTEEDIVKNGHYPFYWDDEIGKVHFDSKNNDKLRHTAAAYRFIGTEDDNKQWEEQYYKDRNNFHKQIAEELRKVPTLTLPNQVQMMKFGGMKENKVFKLKGGVAIPLDDKKKLFYLSGAKHEQGGIDVTPELEAEGGEVVKVNPKSIKVVTAQKIMGGKSPAELVVDASSTGKSDTVFNKVFNYQEEFKDRVGLNDDGTRKAKFGKFIKDGYNKFIKWLNSDSEIDPTQKGGYAKSSEDRRFKKSKEYDPTGHLYIDARMNPLASSEQQGYYREYLGLDSDIPKMNPKAKTEWDDKVEAEKIKNGELPSDFYGTTPRMDVSIQAIADTLNTGNIYRNYDKFKKLHPELPSKDIIKDIYDTGKRILNEPNKWHGVNGDDLYIKPNPDGHIYYEINPLGMLRNFGMKWSPEKGKIFMHDTYDFPGIYTGKGRPMFNRPKEMKIRGAIDFNPKKGSYLLRNDMENYNNYPKPITVDRDVLKLGGTMKKKAVLGLKDVDLENKTKYTDAYLKNKELFENRVTQLKPNNTIAPIKKSDVTGNDFGAIGNNFDGKLTGYDWANIGVNALGSLLTFGHALGNAKVNPLKYSDPIPYTGAKLKTRVNINSAKQKIKRATDKINDSINKNTSNSTVALNRLRNTYLNERDALVDLYTNKENTENQLINKDILNQQSARFKTINDYNTVRRENEKNRYLAERETQENVNNAISGFVQNIGNATSSIANTLEQRDQFNKNMKILGLAYPNLDVERLNKVIRPTNVEKAERARKREKIRLIRKGIIKPSEI